MDQRKRLADAAPTTRDDHALAIEPQSRSARREGAAANNASAAVLKFS